MRIMTPLKVEGLGARKLKTADCDLEPDKNKREWLPPRPSTKPGEVFRARAPNSMVWYEHLSKAGGTSFCKLAQKNMKRPEVGR